jgi:hypothetical protein
MKASAATYEEILLPGGTTNAGLVSRVGDTVRRPQRATSPATRALLEHLERVGFEGAPRYLGIDKRGREILSYIPGEAAIFPHRSWALSDLVLVSVAELLRGYHRAVASFDPAGYEWPHPIPAAFRRGLVSHNDPNLDNVIFAGGRAIALIDFDLAGPGSAAWDLACCARLWVALRDSRDSPEATRRRSLERLAMFADAYGATVEERVGMVEAFVPCHDWCYSVVRRAVASGHEAFGLYWREGGELRAERTRRWLATHASELRASLGVS